MAEPTTVNDAQIDHEARKLLLAVRAEANDVIAGRPGNVDLHLEILDIVSSQDGHRIVERMRQIRDGAS